MRHLVLTVAKLWTETLFTEHQRSVETRNVTAVVHMLILRPGSKIIARMFISDVFVSGPYGTNTG